MPTKALINNATKLIGGFSKSKNFADILWRDHLQFNAPNF